ncbi:MAG: NAD(+) synthase [Flavobacteriales bacterium]|nr:NAD(+) synthase [Flavobacteriales bacterium]
MKNEETRQYITEWIASYAKKSKVSAFVVGVSGGIDSALVSTLCAQTGLKVIAVTMPIHQAKSHVSRAMEHISFLKGKYPNVSHVEIDLTEAFDILAKTLPVCADEKKNLLCLANTRSRMRMTALYHVAGQNGALVAGTGNKIEDFGVGFFTKWGDGGVDFSPIADMTKTEVFTLAAYLGVCESILKAEPSDGLFDTDQSDAMQIGATYPELEWAMEMVEKGMKSSDFTGRDAQVIDIYTSRHAANMHKMRPIPVCKLPLSLHE